MRCEVIAVGTELLLGQITDTNSAWLGEQLALAGIDSHFQVKVGDNRERIVSALRFALERSDAIIICGGLGPTQDDITREAIAEMLGEEMKIDATLERELRERGRGLGTVRAVVDCEFSKEDPHRPSIDEDVGHGHHKHMCLLSKLQQTDPDQGSLAEVECLPGLFARQALRLCRLLGTRHPLKVDDLHTKGK